MVMITSQFAAIIATGIAVSGASAAALPVRNHARAQQQVRMSLDSPAPHHYGRRSVPVAPLPASVSADIINVKSSQANANPKDKAQTSGTGKGKTRKTKAGKTHSNGPAIVDANIHVRAQVEIGNKDDAAHQKPSPAKPQSNSSNNGKPQPKPNAQPSQKPQSKPQAQPSKPKPKPDTQAQAPKAQPKAKASKQESENGSVDAGTHADDPRKDNNAAGSAGMNKRAHSHVIKVGSTSSHPAYYYDSADGSLLHVGIGKRNPTVQASVSANVQVGTSSKRPHTGSGAADRDTREKRGLFTARGREPVGSAIEYLVSLAGRDAKASNAPMITPLADDSELQRRDSRPGVEGVITIVSAVAGNSAPATIASLLLSTDSAANNAFVLNASNSSATHVFLVPANSTAAAASDDGSIPVTLQVPVYSPDEASMVDYCMTYDPNPPAPAPLTAQGCTDQVTDHQSQVFAYNPSSGVIAPMWAVAPSSTDPSAASDDPATSSAVTTSSASSTSSTATSSLATISASSTSSAMPAKRSSADDASAAAEAADPNCDTDSVAAASAGNSTMTPQDVTLIFTPSNAAGILPSSGQSAKDVTTFFPPGSGASDDGNVGTSSASPAADATGDEDDGEDDEDTGDDGEDDSDVSPSSVDPSTAESSSTEPTAEDDPASEDDTSTADAASLDASADLGETITDDEVTPTLSSNSSPSMTPVPDASTPYSWMFTPQK
ncbi:hypothetical protein FRC04_003550 [Tulasnella sp. 424]|nr:hypothetical protein FRC04_003550 [Tulasnella sp. 424]KAG8974959.1 hypothetical protein FRC05_006636 [Tulasnella sp. 425]